MAEYRKDVTCPICSTDDAILLFLTTNDSYHFICPKCGPYTDSMTVEQSDEELNKAIAIIDSLTKDGWPDHPIHA